MSRKKKAIIGSLLAVVVIAAGVTTYIQGKHYITRKEVKEYLVAEGHAESDIVELESFMANLPGDRNWMVSVGLKGEKGLYSYYYDREQDKVILESHNQD